MVGVLAILAVVQTGSLFSADAWNNVTYTAGEVRNPKRNLPLSLALGTILVLGLYILANFVYLLALPLHGDPQGATIFSRGIQYASEDRVATAVLQQIFSRTGAYLMAGAILISTFGCANGLTTTPCPATACFSRPRASCIRSGTRPSPRFWCRPCGPACSASPVPIRSCSTSSSARS
jgi:APA family basic amino acid/polyamine antiporter